MTKKKKTLYDKYKHSETVRKAILPERGNVRQPTVCNCGNVDYKSLAFVVRRSMRVMDNLAKSIALLEARAKETETSYGAFLKSANEFNEQLAKENNDLKARLEVMKHVN